MASLLFFDSSMPRLLTGARGSQGADHTSYAAATIETAQEANAATATRQGVVDAAREMSQGDLRPLLLAHAERQREFRRLRFDEQRAGEQARRDSARRLRDAAENQASITGFVCAYEEGRSSRFKFFNS